MLIGGHVSSAGGLVKALERAEAHGVVVHPGSGKGAAADATLQLIGDAFAKALAESERCPLLLENTAGGGGTVGRNFSELATLIERIGGHERARVCLDSCHLLAS